MPRRPARLARGASLIELLAGMMLGLIVLGIALQLVFIARARYQRIADDALIEDRGMQALELLTGAIRQAGWITDAPSSSAARRWPDASAPPALTGADDCGQPAMANDLHCVRAGIQGSDALLVRFAGRSAEADGLRADGSIIDCSGQGVPERMPDGRDDPRAGTMLFFLARAQDGEPQLMCRHRSRKNGRLQADRWTTHYFVRGVETLQLLYTLAPADSPASAAALPARALGPAQWPRVQAVHIALVVRGERADPHLAGRAAPALALFPGLAPGRANAQDIAFHPTAPPRRRAVFAATVRLRNPPACEFDAC